MPPSQLSLLFQTGHEMEQSPEVPALPQPPLFMQGSSQTWLRFLLNTKQPGHLLMTWAYAYESLNTFGVPSGLVGVGLPCWK